MEPSSLHGVIPLIKFRDTRLPSHSLNLCWPHLFSNAWFRVAPGPGVKSRLTSEVCFDSVGWTAAFTVTAWINLYGDQTSRLPTPLFPPMERVFDCGERLRIWSPWLMGFASMCACMVRYGRTLSRLYGTFATM